MNKNNIPKHVAIILDGNGRWAKKRGMPRSYGHFMGGRNLFSIARVAKDLGIKKLSVFAFSTENWKRPKEEVEYLMSFPVEYYHNHLENVAKIDYQIIFSGRKDRLPKALLEMMLELEKKTQKYEGFVLNICVDYGSKYEIVNAVNELKLPITEEELETKLMVKEPVDLLIRTSGEQRISNFLLWQIAYAEFYFAKVHWPAFKKRNLEKAIKNYQKRQRRFGGLA